MTSEKFADGLKIRKEVLGEEYVDKALKNVDDFNRPMQELVTEFGWGVFWTRPGLALKTRSMLNLAMLTALNRPHEFEIHLRGAINNGVTRDEIKEILFQSAAYCGWPAAIDSFRIAQRVFAEADAAAQDTR